MSFLNSICHLLGKRFKVVFQALGFWILLSGCASAPKPFVKKVEPFQPSNYSVSRTHLKADLVRVAVLLPEVDRQLTLDYGATLELFHQVFQSEVMKPRLFEVVMVDAIRFTISLIGPMKLSSNQPFPNELFASLKEQLDCQAVLFSELTNLRTMSPMLVGWHMKLVDTESLQTIWEINELYDGGNERVATAAFQYYEAEIGAGFRKPDPELVLASPRLFGQYTLHSVFDPAAALK